MRNIQWRFPLAGLAMLLAAITAFALKPALRAQDAPRLDLEHIVPKSFGDWTVDPETIPIPPTPDVQANLDRIYSEIVTRTYVNSLGERVMLTIAYGGDQSDALKAHRQEVCYAAQGFEVRGVEHDLLHLRGVDIPVTRMLARRGPRSEPVTYWFTMGDQVVMGRLERLLVQIRFGLSGRTPDGMLVRVSNIATDTRQAYAEHDRFIVALIDGIRQSQVPRFTGSQPS